MHSNPILLTEKSKYYSTLGYINNMSEEITTIKVCPHCNENNIIKYGKVKSNNAQIFYCKSCKKRFVETIGTPFYRSRKNNEIWTGYFENMWTGNTIRECAEKMEISQNTSFSWRHKILSYYLKFFKRKSLYNDVDVMVRIYVQNSKKEKESALMNVEKENITLKLGEKIFFLFTKNNDNTIEFLPFDKYPLSRLSLKRRLDIIFSNVKKVGVYGNNVIKSYAKKCVDEVNRVEANSELFIYERYMRSWISGFWGISFRYILNYFNWFRIYYVNNKMYKETRQYIYGTEKVFSGIW